MFVTILVVQNPVINASAAHGLFIDRIESAPCPELCSRGLRRNQTVSPM